MVNGMSGKDKAPAETMTRENPPQIILKHVLGFSVCISSDTRQYSGSLLWDLGVTLLIILGVGGQAITEAWGL
jgi:hypothetical protein